MEVFLYQMSKQLQLRLQYARLKVEHGWVCAYLLTFVGRRRLLTHSAFRQQKQNINEVENLFLHHYASVAREGHTAMQAQALPSAHQSLELSFMPSNPDVRAQRQDRLSTKTNYAKDDTGKHVSFMLDSGDNERLEVEEGIAPSRVNANESHVQPCSSVK